jgi:type II secretory pathway component GspD/PulD (secretin)
MVTAADEAPVNDASLKAAAMAEEGRAELRDNRYDRGRELLEQAHGIDPSDESIAKSLRQAEALIAGEQLRVRKDADAAALRSQLDAVDARQAVQRAELLAQQGRHFEARERLAQARALLAPAAADAADVDAQTRLSHIDALDQEFSRQEGERRAQARDRDHLRVAAEDRARIDVTQDRSLLDERLQRIGALKERKLYELALSHCRALLRDFPGEPRAEEAFAQLLEATHEQRRLDAKEREIELRQEVVERIERSLIPTGFDGSPSYPEDWHLRHLDLNRLDSPVELEPWHEALLDRLGRRVSFNFDAADLTEASNLLAKQGSINLVIDPAIAAADNRLTLKADNMRLDSALSWLTRLSGTTWQVYNGAVYIGDQAESTTVMSVYDIADLSFPAVDQAGMTLGFSTQGTGGSFATFQQGEPAATVSPEDVVDLIQSSVSPDAWDDEANSIVIRGTTLFVTAPRQVHVLLNEFLTAQAHAKNILVHIDAKWLEINDGYLEEIGVDWGASASILQTPNGGFQPGFQSGTQTSSFIGNVRNRLPTALVSPQPLTAGSGLSLNVMRLGGAQVAAVLAAIERKNQARILDAPSIATLNGVRGSCFFGTQIAFISDYEVVSENLDPTISVLNIGANLDIKPFVSADRKHVVMEFRPALASARFFVELINAPRILPIDPPPPPPGGPLPPPPDIVAYPIELPNVAIKEVATTIDIPDRGTILVGGFGRHIEETASAKVPFLGHIPYLGRLFGRRGRYSDRSQLFLLATVNIITYQEAEARL